MSNKDKIVANVYETFDYSKFSVIPENRGQKETKGIKERKMSTLQAMIDNGTWVTEFARVKINNDFEVVDGAHTFELLKRNKLPVRYEIIKDERFNDVSKKQLVGAIYNVNTVTTSWSSEDFFKGAVEIKARLALPMKEYIEEFNNYFLWTDLMALLMKDSDFFLGRWRKINMETMDDKELTDQIKHHTFRRELEPFAAFVNKARIAPRKGIVLKSAYDILWHAREMVEPKLFRKCLASIPEETVSSNRMATEKTCMGVLINYYNKSQGQSVKTDTVLWQINHRNTPQEVLELKIA